jgi:serine/threonine protein kinase
VLDGVAEATGHAPDGVITAPFDTELFGHWWFEGVDFIAAAYRGLAGSEGIRPVTASQHTRAGTVLGTLAYMSPEQARGLAVDERTDIFALGAILYEMLTGRRAFQRPTAPDTLSAILTSDPTETGLPEGLPPLRPRPAAVPGRTRQRFGCGRSGAAPRTPRRSPRQPPPPRLRGDGGGAA